MPKRKSERFLRQDYSIPINWELLRFDVPNPLDPMASYPARTEIGLFHKAIDAPNSPYMTDPSIYLYSDQLRPPKMLANQTPALPYNRRTMKFANWWSNFKKQAEDAPGSLEENRINIRELFEAKELAAISDEVDPQIVIKRFIPDWIKAMDKLGKMLFVIYLNKKRFTDEFGEDGIFTLIQNLKKLHLQLGKLIINVNKKMPEASGGMFQDQQLSLEDKLLS